MERSQRDGISALCITLDVQESDYRSARSQIERVYVEKPRYDKKSGKIRQLCYPPDTSDLYMVQSRIKDRVLCDLNLLPEVLGYRRKSHNINAADNVCGHDFMGKVDISKFHPSITPRHVAAALTDHGVSPSWSREIARITTFKNALPQGAPTSNHIANVVMDSMLRRRIKAFADRRHVRFINFGDDIAFFGRDAAAVRSCVKRAKEAFRQHGFRPNDKCRDCEHRGGERMFLGCATGREQLDYPRKKYRAFRSELRALLQAERMRCAPEPLTTSKQLNSLKHRIRYVNRLNRGKARRLFDLFYRLCHARRTGKRIREHASASIRTPA